MRHRKWACIPVVTLLCTVPGATDPRADSVRDDEVVISGRVLDGLDRPVPGAHVKVVPRAGGPAAPLAEARTGADGRFSCPVAGGRVKVAILIEKGGYHATREDDRREVYRLREEFDWDLARRLPRLRGEDLDRGLMELWSQWTPPDSFAADRYFFKHQSVFRPALRRLLKDRRAADDFEDRLDLWGDPADQDLFPGKRRSDRDLAPARRSYAPVRDVREPDLADAIMAALNQAKGSEYFDKHPEERSGIGFMTFSVELDRVMVACGSDPDPLDSIFVILVFHREDKKWVLRSFMPVGGM